MWHLAREARDYGELAETMLASPEPGLAAFWIMKRARAIAQLRRDAAVDFSLVSES